MSDTLPPDGGDGGGYDPDIWDYKWEYGIEELGYADTWMNEDVTLFNEMGFAVTEPIEYWHEIVTTWSAEELLDAYGLDNIELIHELEDLGLWDAEDWETWREAYEQA